MSEEALTALIDSRVSIALDRRDRAKHLQKLRDTASDIQRIAAEAQGKHTLGGVVVRDDLRELVLDRSVLHSRAMQVVDDLRKVSDALRFAVHESSPVVADSEPGRSDDPAVIVQEAGGSPAVRAGACDCVAPAESSPRGAP